MRSKLRVAVLLGGRSVEHDVSILSATNVLKAFDPAKYDVMPVLITRSGKWLALEAEGGPLPNPIPEDGSEICLVPGGSGGLLVIPKDGPAHELPAIDILFPVLHGLRGEDGSIQGLAEVAMVPFVGCGILGSAIAIDKDVAKRLLKEAGLPVARCLTFRHGEAPSFEDVTKDLGLRLRRTFSTGLIGRGHQG